MNAQDYLDEYIALKTQADRTERLIAEAKNAKVELATRLSAFRLYHGRVNSFRIKDQVNFLKEINLSLDDIGETTFRAEQLIAGR